MTSRMDVIVLDCSVWVLKLLKERGKIVQKGVYAKMARGEMVRFMAGIHAEAPEQMKAFNWSGYRFDPDRSSDTEFVFVRTEIPGNKSAKKLPIPKREQ